MSDEARTPDEAEDEEEDAIRRAELAEAEMHVLAAGEKLAKAAPQLESIANRLRELEPDGKWRHLYKASKKAALALERLRVQFPQAGLQTAFDQLLAADSDWSHPSQVLSEPQPSYRELAKLAKSWLDADSGESRQKLADIVQKLERAAEIEESARRQRGEPESPG